MGVKEGKKEGVGGIVRWQMGWREDGNDVGSGWERGVGKVGAAGAGQRATMVRPFCPAQMIGVEGGRGGCRGGGWGGR